MLSLDARDVLGAIPSAEEGQLRFVQAWLERTLPFCWQLHVAAPMMRERIDARCLAFIRSLRLSAEQAETLSLGDTAMKEPLQHLAFIAGWLAGEGLPVSAVLALVFGLSEAIGGPSLGFFRGLSVAAADAFQAGIEERALAHHRRVIEKCQIVLPMSDRLVALLLVGDPDGQAIDEAISRMMMLALMREPHALMVDGSGLFRAEETAPLAAELLAVHELARRLTIVTTGIPPAALKSKQALGLTFDFCESVEAALAKWS